MQTVMQHTVAFLWHTGAVRWVAPLVLPVALPARAWLRKRRALAVLALYPY